MTSPHLFVILWGFGSSSSSVRVGHWHLLGRERTWSEGNSTVLPPTLNVAWVPFFRLAERCCDRPSMGFTENVFPRCVSAAGGVQTGSCSETHLHGCWCKTREPTSRYWSRFSSSGVKPTLKSLSFRFSAEHEGSHLPARAAAHFWGIVVFFFCETGTPESLILIRKDYENHYVPNPPLS